MRQEFPSKLLGETKNFTAYFLSQLGASESISTTQASVTLYSGTDPSPNLMYVSNQISGTNVIVLLQGGVLGNIYELKVTITTSLGQTLQVTGYIAVIPDLP